MLLNKCTDNKLLNLFREGNQAAFDQIHARYAHQVYMYAFNILSKTQECEDIVQNVFVSLWNQKKEVEIKSLKSYLFRAVKNQIFNYFRNNKISDTDLTRLTIIDISNSALENMEFKELEKIIQDCVQNLPNRCQHIFRLSRFEEKSHKEIAEDLDISRQTVKNQISKALKIIKGNLVEEKTFPVPDRLTVEKGIAS